MSLPILNISTYRFVALDGLEALRDHLHAEAQARDLKGTVLLAEEGINLFLAGSAEAVNGWLAVLRADPRFADLPAKESWSEAQPFERLKVKVKREIIRMNMPTVRPQGGRAPAVSPATVARWLAEGHDDAGREVVMLDTRNSFEVDAGAFDKAIDWRLEKFSDFPAALAAHREALQDKTIVSYCTGGIRCEKAALVMQDLGLAHSYQLEGGILKYFEETDGAPHWHGGCFVFDEREVLDPTLQATPVGRRPTKASAT
ncbi:sulfurtransferase [Ideonella azotifigens]|uniref:tRNA uridine(34) hydroxylase n=1 Tax=Ideonella azotifigens TaxID=513160 RepID=A0ABP3V449_9BURK|nr:sulfurtransferase [Ideonella azotifigens]MCD2341035.1 sulfurtransferase [Ideonella azotifigens]